MSALIKDVFSKLIGKKGSDETSLIEQFRYPKFGPGQLWEEVAKDIEFFGGRIIYNCKVEKFCKRGDSIEYIVCNSAGKHVKVEGDIYISTMPIKDLVTGIEGDKPNGDIISIAEGLPYRDFVTVGLLTERLNLVNKTRIKTLSDIVPDCWIYVQDRGVKLGRIQIFNNWSPYMVSDPQKYVWIGLEYFCSENDEFWSMSEEELTEYAVSELLRMNVISADSVLDSHCEKVKKAYPAYFDTYSRMEEIVDYLSEIENLYCIGRNGQHRYNNMDHSMLTAMLAVDVIKNNGANKREIWNVNSEKEYHESK